MSKRTKLPVDTPKFWSGRIQEAEERGGGLYYAVYNTHPRNWERIQRESAEALTKCLNRGMRVLDAGCGYGALYEVLPYKESIDYRGIDISPDLIETARKRCPSVQFIIGDLRSIPFPNNYFDRAICRAIKYTIVDNLADGEWEAMRSELLRVAKAVILLEYESILKYEIIND